MTYQTISQSEALVYAFEQQTLPRSQWTHAAHLTVALWYLVHHAPSEAIDRMRRHIQRYNAAQGIQQTPNSGYHETITLFWLCFGQRYLIERRVSRVTPDAVNQFITYCHDQTLPLDYYSRYRLLSWDARIGWLEPDLHPLLEPIRLALENFNSCEGG